jgi:hypothetical protein
LVAKAAKRGGIEEDQGASDVRLGTDRDALIEELQAERDAHDSQLHGGSES